MARLTKHGNSTGVVLPRDVLEQAGLSRGDRVKVTAEENAVVIRRAEDKHQRAEDILERALMRYDRALQWLAK